ncbi:MAG TPA: M28 family peptidase [Pyrinomonadaceae bacterium]|nr:M28 family peptidase [Pyrinomonadaceae bacterium]
MKKFLLAILLAAPALLFAPTLSTAQTTGLRSGQTTQDKPGSHEFDAAQLLHDVEVLSSDAMGGRKAGTPDGAKARDYVVQRFKQSGLEAFGASYVQPFTFSYTGKSDVHQGANVVGFVRGKETATPTRYLVVTAHYDHLGTIKEQIYNGADDNASGTAALFALAAYFNKHRPAHSIIFVAFDAEENSGEGGRKFVSEPPVEKQSIVLNVNLDMISRNDRNELYASGIYHYPFLKPYLEKTRKHAHVKLLFGHDSPDLPPQDNWTTQSDHVAFHRAKIPFVYFGVEDHKDYHKPTDDFENIQPAFYVHAVETILDALKAFDKNLSKIEKQKHTASAARRTS